MKRFDRVRRCIAPAPNRDNRSSVYGANIGSVVLRGDFSGGSTHGSSGLWRRLPGERVPALRLPFAPGEVLPGSTISLADLARRRSLAVLFYADVVPDETGESRAGGRQDLEDARLAGWREHEPELEDLGYWIVAVSSQSSEAQVEFAMDRMLSSFMFLSDSDLRLADELGLPTRMVSDGARVYETLTMLVRQGGRIWWVFFPLEHPERDAALVLERIRNPHA